MAKLKAPTEIGGVPIDPRGADFGQALIFDGTQFAPDDVGGGGGSDPSWVEGRIGKQLSFLVAGSYNFLKKDYPGLVGIGIDVWSGGGASAGAPAGSASNVAWGGGGGGGGRARKLFVPVALIPSVLPITVGPGGTPGAAGAAGGDGGATQVGTSSATPTSPTVRSVGAVSNGGLPLPALGAPAGYGAGDLLLLCIEDQGNTTPSVITGYEHVPGSPVFNDVATASSDTRIQVLWRIATGVTADDIPATVPGLTDHGNARIIAIQAGTFDADDPFDTNAGQTNLANTTVTWPSITTTNPDTLIVLAGSNHWSDAWASQTNANLTGITEHIDNNTTAAGRGSLGVWTGLKATAGAIGTSTAVLAGAQNSSALVFGINRNPSLGSEPANAILARATPGTGGITGANAVATTARTLLIGGNGGSGTDGDMLYDGARGGDVYQTTGGSIGGTPNGGASPLSEGPGGVLEANGVAGKLGAGGGGMRNSGAVAAKVGGAGGPGGVILTLYF